MANANPWTVLEEALAKVASYQREERMIYQREAKEHAARAASLPLDTYYHLPHGEWAAIRTATKEN